MTDAAENHVFPLVIESADGRAFKFTSASDVRSMISEAYDFYLKIKALKNGYSDMVADKFYSKIYDYNSRMRGVISDQEYANAANEIVGGGIWPRADTKALMVVFDEFPDSAPYILAALHFKKIPTNIVDSRAIGFRDVTQQSAGILAYTRARRNATGERRQLAKLVDETKDLNSRLRDQIGEFQRQFDFSLKENSRLIAEKITSINNEIAKNEQHAIQIEQKFKLSMEKIDEYLKISESYLNKFSDELEKKLIIQVPTKYWSKKANEHRKSWAIASIVFVGVFVFGVGILYFILPNIMSNVYHSLQSVGASRELLGYGPILFVTLPALGLAWALRHISRVIVQNMSLEADARLRSTITSTFRALLRRRSASEAELMLVLNALFRPVDGKDHTDVSPPSVLELLNVQK